MLLRNSCRSAIAASVLALLAACHGRHGSTGGPASTTAYWSATTSERGDLAPAGGSPLLEVPGIGSDFVLLSGATFVEETDGRAFLTAVLARRGAAADRLALRVLFDGLARIGASESTSAPIPRTELAPAAYREAGGPVDVADWRFYGVRGGELRGLGALAGATMDLAAADATGLQCGLGADNWNITQGASVRLLAGDSEEPITLAFALRTSERTYAVASPGDATLGGAPRATVTVPALGGDFHVVSGGAFVERSDGSLRFDAVLADGDATDRRFALSLLARDRREPLAGDLVPPSGPRTELAPEAYRSAGGPIDVIEWRHYAVLDGVLQGLGSLAGAEVAVRGGAFALQVGYGASGIDGDFGASASLSLLVVSQPLASPWLPWGATGGTLRASLRRAYVATADEPVVDPDFGTIGGHALRLPGLAEDLVVASGGEFCEHAGGRAELFAELVSASNPDEQWNLVLDFDARIDANEPGGLPEGSPLLRLAGGAYAPNGGTIEPGSWHYYSIVVGELQGVGPRVGARIVLASALPAVQVGRGANGANLRFGLLGGLAAQLASQPHTGPSLPDQFGPAEILLTLERIGDRCALAAARDVAVSPVLGDEALHLPGLGSDLVLLPGARFAEHANGTAELRGVFARATSPSRRLLATLRFAGRVDRDAEPPAGSPRLELHPSAYAAGGGAIDPATWHYYLEVEGSLVGLDAWQGGRMRITPASSVLQVGRGASGRNLRPGACGFVAVEVLAQPASGAAWLPGSPGELRVNLFDACP